jgi:hypothetical protein
MSRPVPEGSVLAISAEGNGHGVYFFCPGCQQIHKVWSQQYPNELTGSGWKWNGDFIKPTFEPSILVRGTKFTEKGERDYQAWLAAGTPDLPKDYQFESQPNICHSFVRDGMIQFLSDCSHKLAGQTVPLPAAPLEQRNSEGRTTKLD